MPITFTSRIPGNGPRSSASITECGTNTLVRCIAATKTLRCSPRTKAYRFKGPASAPFSRRTETTLLRGWVLPTSPRLGVILSFAAVLASSMTRSTLTRSWISVPQPTPPTDCRTIRLGHTRFPTTRQISVATQPTIGKQFRRPQSARTVRPRRPVQSFPTSQHVRHSM